MDYARWLFILEILTLVASVAQGTERYCSFSNLLSDWSLLLFPRLLDKIRHLLTVRRVFYSHRCLLALAMTMPYLFALKAHLSSTVVAIDFFLMPVVCSNWP